MKVPFNTWFNYFLKIVDILDTYKINYALFGAAAISIISRPISTKDIDILVYPFPTNKQVLEILDKICLEIKCIKRFIEIDAIEGKRAIIIADTEKGPLGIEMWEKILRREPEKFFKRSIKIPYQNKKIRILKPEDLLATKLCELSPEPLDREKIETLINNSKYEINLDEVIKVIIDLNYETVAIWNILDWYPKKLPEYAKTVIRKLLPYLSTCLLYTSPSPRDRG